MSKIPPKPLLSELERRSLALRERAKLEAARQERNSDHGTMGMAMAMRPADLVNTIQAGVRRKEMHDAHLIDRMLLARHLTAAQHKTAHRVLEMHDEAGFEPVVSASYAPSGWNKGHDDETEEPPAIGRFRRLLGGCTRGAADILHGMCLEQHPGTARLATLTATLDDLGKLWGFA